MDKGASVVPFGDRGPDPEDDDWGYWISVRVRRRRRELELTQQQVVDQLVASGHHMTPATWSRVESGKVELARGAALLVLISEALRCSITFVLGLSSDPDRWEPDSLQVGG